MWLQELAIWQDDGTSGPAGYGLTLSELACCLLTFIITIDWWARSHQLWRHSYGSTEMYGSRPDHAYTQLQSLMPDEGRQVDVSCLSRAQWVAS